jgi:hypothetical protein
MGCGQSIYISRVTPVTDRISRQGSDLFASPKLLSKSSELDSSSLVACSTVHEVLASYVSQDLLIK